MGPNKGVSTVRTAVKLSEIEELVDRLRREWPRENKILRDFLLAHDIELVYDTEED